MMQILDNLEFISVLLSYGVIVSGIILFSLKWLTPLKSVLVWSALNSLKWFGLAIGILAVWFWIEKWVLQYDFDVFASRAFGAYAYGVWLPLAFSLFATFTVLFSKTRRYIFSWLLISLVGFGPIFYEFWFYFVVQRHREFVSAKYVIEWPTSLQIFTTAIVAGLVCLFIISIPMLWRFIRKR
jgi:hypothetical protein